MDYGSFIFSILKIEILRILKPEAFLSNIIKIAFPSSPMFPKLLLIVSIITLFFSPIAAKKVLKSFSISELHEEPWKYLTKFGFERGTGTFSVRAKINHPLQISSENQNSEFSFAFMVFLDIEWPEALKLESCSEKNNLARFRRPLQLKTNGDWSNAITSTLGNNARPYVWYFVMSDCSGDHKNSVKIHELDYIIEFEVSIHNSDGSEFSIEDKDFMTPFMMLMIFCAIGLLYNFKKFYSEYRNNMHVDYPLIFVNLAIFLQLCALVCEIIHLTVYSSNGMGSFVFNLLNNVFSIFSQFVFTILLILISWGWTINFTDLESMNCFLPFSGFIALIQIVCTIISKISDDEYYKFHDYENWAGYSILILRVALFLYFIKGLYCSFLEARETIKRFIVKLGLYGSVYFLAIPIIVIITTIVAPYCRHKVVVIGSLSLQILGMIFMTVLFNETKGDYFEISYHSKPLLPFGKILRGKID